MTLSSDDVERLAVGRRATAHELSDLLVHGFVVVDELLDQSQIESLRAEFERLVELDGDSRRRELGNRRTNARRENEVFSICWRHRVVLDAATRLLGSTYEVGNVDLRDPEPWGGAQRLHPDHGPTPVPGITATWFIDPFTAENGATRMLAGSHEDPPPVQEVPIPGTEIPGEGETLGCGSAGSVLIRDARLFHAGGLNLTQRRRRSALVFFQHSIPDS